MDEGSGTTLADSSGNGYDLTITAGGGSAWVTIDGGTAYRQKERLGGSKAQSETLHNEFDGLTQVTVIMALQDMRGDAGMPRAWFIGSSGGNGKISMNANRAPTTGLYEGRWMREPDDDNHVRSQFDDLTPIDPTGYAAYHVVIIEYDPTNNPTVADRIKMFGNNIPLTYSGGSYDDPMVALDIASTDRFCLFNRPAQNNGAEGKYGYFEAWDGLLTAQQKSDATAALLLDCDSPWDGGGPPTSVSFTSEPSATNIDTDRVTANATAESDAP